MQVQKLQSYSIKYRYTNSQNTKDISPHPPKSSVNYNPIAYRDYNITFCARTPEDFYAQEFNRNNMPSTMKDYLFLDYENRQHIPPEQMMREVFKYLEIADNFTDVKSIYPNEELFANLHENHTNSRTDTVFEIEMAKELSDVPLFKDGSDNFGIYLLRKIYQDGKTLREINKDFFEKDMNIEYKGIITKPMEYETLGKYGISYPNTAFWNSFIKTRDEYRKFFQQLPKDSVIPGVHIQRESSKSDSISKKEPAASVSEKPRKRRFNIKQHQKKSIQKEIADRKIIDPESVKKIVRKRFAKDDPEASFIVRYMSPIMTIAAERAHMSEELKSFADYERRLGKSGNEDTMLARFWKQNPKMIEVFSHAVTDTMDMFEDIYGEGGSIAINTDLEKIIQESEKKKIIDYINPEFFDLLQYSQIIDPERRERYDLHDKIQRQWEQHFDERYGKININAENPNIPQNGTEALLLEEKMALEAKKNNAQLYKLRTKDGRYIYITSNLDKVLIDNIKAGAKYFPTEYASKYIKAIKKEEFSNKFKLSLAAKNTGEEFEDEQLLTKEEFDKEFYKILNFHYDNVNEERAAHLSMIDVMDSDKENQIKVYPELYNTAVFGINEGAVDGDENDLKQFNTFMKNSKNKIDLKYSNYLIPPTKKEIEKMKNIIFQMLENYDKQNLVLSIEDSNSEIITMLKETLPYELNKNSLDFYLALFLKNNPYSKTILQNSNNPKIRQAKFEFVMNDLADNILFSLESSPAYVILFNNKVYQNHKQKLLPDIRYKIENAVNKLDFNQKITYYSE